MIDETRPAWEDADNLDALPAAKAKTAASYRAWVERAGSQEAAFTGEEIWTPERRFGRVFERLALPGFTRAMRYDLLTALGAADIYPLEADALHFADGDADDRRRQAPARVRRPDAARAPRPRPRGRLRAADQRVRPRPGRLGHAHRARRPDRGAGIRGSPPRSA